MESPASQAAPSTKPAAGQKKAVSVEAFVFLGVFILIFGLIGHKMGMINLLNTMMNTAFDLLINTVLYIMGIAVLAGVQFYTACTTDYADGKGGMHYLPYSGLCLETQHYPDSPNHPNFPTTTLRPGEIYDTTTIHAFRVDA